MPTGTKYKLSIQFALQASDGKFTFVTLGGIVTSSRGCILLLVEHLPLWWFILILCSLLFVVLYSFMLFGSGDSDVRLGIIR